MNSATTNSNVQQQSSINTMTCTNCGASNSSAGKFCSSCGKAIQDTSQASQNQGDKFCPKCRQMTKGDFCSQCGSQTV